MRAAVFLLLLIISGPLVSATSRLKAINPKTIKNTSKSLDIYSALRDPILGEVRLFLEYYPYHQSQLTEEERQDAMQPAMRDVFWGCLFSNTRNFSQPTAIQAKRVHQMAPVGNGWVDCVTEERYSYVKLQLQSSHVHYQILQVEDIPTQRVGAVAACVAPLFSHRPDIHQWMHHYTQLGVNRFHMYRPSIHAHEREQFGAVHEIWRTVMSFNFRDGETHTDPFHPFEHPLATWHQYSPSNRENYFGQVIMYNECVMRARYEYDYAMLFDVDEFLYINTTALGLGVRLLPDFLDRELPPKVASLEFGSWHYPKNCPVTTIGSLFQRHKLRDAGYLSAKNGKIIVRPRHADEVFVHFVVGVAEGWAQKLFVPVEKAFVKHIVWMHPAHVHCNDYVHEDSGLHPADDGYEPVVNGVL